MRTLRSVLSVLLIGGVLGIAIGIPVGSIIYIQDKSEEPNVTIEQACINGYEWAVLVNANGQCVALEQAFKASEVPGACAQPVECEDL